MGSITTALCATFEQEILEAIHNLTQTSGDTFAMALIKPSPAGTFGRGTTNYSNLGSDEVTGTGYTAGGFAWTASQNVTPAVQGDSNSTVTASWSANPTWGPNASIAAAGALIYNTSKGNRAVAVFSFGGTQQVVGGTLVVQLPTNNYQNAIVRLT